MNENKNIPEGYVDISTAATSQAAPQVTPMVQTAAQAVTQPMQFVNLSSGTVAEEPPRKKRGVLIACLVAGIIVVLAALGFIGVRMYQDYQCKLEMTAAVNTETFYHGISVQNQNLGGKTLEQARQMLAQLEQDIVVPHTLTLKYGKERWEITSDDLDFSFNTAAVLEEAYAYGRSGTLEERYNMVQGLLTQPKSYEIREEVSYETLKNKLAKVVEDVNRPAEDAKITSFSSNGSFSIADGKTGVEVDSERFLPMVQEALNSGVTEIDLPVKETPFKVTAAELRKNMSKIAHYTTVSTNTANGNHNMKLAMEAINGTVVQPGEVFSYFGVVGKADSSQGYKAAHAIIKGRLIDSIGGGICQTSTTLYGAALRANMEIMERSNHSIQSSYCPIGQDAAVSYPVPDFKFKNNSAYPVYIAAGMEGKNLFATFYGGQDPAYDKIEIVSKMTEHLKPLEDKVTYIKDNKLEKDQWRLDAKPRSGARATASRVFYKGGKVVKTEALASSYYPAAGYYYSYGPDSDMEKAPKPNVPAVAPPASSVPASSVPMESGLPPESIIPPESYPGIADETPGDPVTGTVGPPQ